MNFFQNIGKFIKEKILSRLTSLIMLVIVSVICLALLLVQYFKRADAVSPLQVIGAVVVPFQTGVNEVGKFLFTNEQERLSLSEAQEKIAELEKENNELKLRNNDLLSLEGENDELRKLLEAKERLGDYASVQAQIIGNDGVNTFERFTIDKGSADGIKINMNVVNGDGLIGIVTQVGINYAIVETIIEDGMNVSAMTRNGNLNCIAAGSFKTSRTNELKLTNIAADSAIKPDMMLVTSYISDRFLPNLKIGYVKTVQVEADGLTGSGTITTAVDFTRLNHVLVITTLKEELE